MINLGDYIGRILSEIAIARANADRETLRVAEIYNSHPLLKNFSVPRIKLPQVNIDIPLVISEVEEPLEEPEELPPDKVADIAEQAVINELNKRNIALSAAEMTRLIDGLSTKSTELKVLRQTPGTSDILAEKLSSESTRILNELPAIKDKLGDKDIAQMESNSREAIREGVTAGRKPPPRIKISALTTDVRDAGGADKVVRIKMSVLEDGVEWTSVDEDGTKRDKLIPE